MKQYLEKTLNQKITIKENTDTYTQLPLVYQGRYTTYKATMSGVSWVILKPEIDVGLATLRKDRLKIEQLTNLNCAIYFETTSFYIKEKLLEEGIPFIIKDKLIYLPFIGYLLSQYEGRNIKPVKKLSFLTQKLIITAIYNKWRNVTATDAAGQLGVTKMSISRCFDEIEYLNIDLLGKKGKSRVIIIPEDIRSLWQQLQNKLRTPVITRYELSVDLKLKLKAGVSALCEYTLLEDNHYPTYAITKKDSALQSVKTMRQATNGDEIACVVLELGYFIDYDTKGTEDPLSVALSMSEDELMDERIQASVNKMIEERLC